MASSGSGSAAAGQRKAALRLVLLITLLTLSRSQVPTYSDFLGLGPEYTYLNFYLYQYGLVEYFVRLATVYGFTLMAPSNTAFQRLGPVMDCITQNATTLQSILLYHTVLGNYPAMHMLLYNGWALPTAQGENITITVNGTGTLILDDDVVVETPDLLLLPNATVHGTGAVLVPTAALQYIEYCPRPLPLPLAPVP